MVEAGATSRTEIGARLARRGNSCRLRLGQKEDPLCNEENARGTEAFATVGLTVREQRRNADCMLERERSKVAPITRVMGML